MTNLVFLSAIVAENCVAVERLKRVTIFREGERQARLVVLNRIEASL